MVETGDLPASEWIREALERYEGQLARYAFRIVKDRDRACEVVQETFLRLCREPREAVDGHLAKWLFMVCRNQALDVLRKERRMTAIATDQLDSPSRDPSPLAAAEQRDTAAKIARYMHDLPDNQQDVLRLKFQNNLSYAEISDVTGLSVTNVGFLIHRGVKTLRERMQLAERALP